MEDFETILGLSWMETGDKQRCVPGERAPWVVHMLGHSKGLMRLGSHLIVPDCIWPPGRKRVGQTLVDKKAKH